MPSKYLKNQLPLPQSWTRQFDHKASDCFQKILQNYPGLHGLELAVSLAPDIADPALSAVGVPLSSTVKTANGTRVVLYRYPILQRCQDHAELTTMILVVLCEQISELTGVTAQDLHPDYPQN